jgi:vacuolar iron transporter family protein
MPTTPHIEKHFTATEAVRDVVIGMSDGLTVPFALAAGLSGAVVSSGIIVTAGLAEIAAGSIAMGLGGYLAARTDREHYESERRREFEEVEEIPEQEAREVRDIFTGYGLTAEQAEPVVTALRSDVNRWVDFMMRFELGLEEPQPKRARTRALTLALS